MDNKVLTRLPFLNAVLSESLRLHPALITGGSRQAGEHGITIAGTFIPPYTNIVAPQYHIARSEFASTLKFLSCPSRTDTDSQFLLPRA